MAEARSRQLWDHTSEVLALIANGLLRGKDQPIFRAQQFHPFHVKQRRELTKEEALENFRMLRVFCPPPREERRAESDDPKPDVIISP